MPDAGPLICPHGVNGFRPDERLRADDRLGRDAPRRVRPTRFTSTAMAVAEFGGPRRRVACPEQNLVVPGRAEPTPLRGTHTPSTRGRETRPPESHTESAAGEGVYG